MRNLIAVSTLVMMAACATTTTDVPPAVVDTPPIEKPIMPSAFGLAMDTVDQLVDAGNEQHAIDRIKQLLGNPSLTDAQTAEALMKLGELRYGDGNDVMGAIAVWSELSETYPFSDIAIEAEPFRDAARGEADALHLALASDELSPTDEFEAVFRLGDHQAAADLMLARDLAPDNAYLVDMFQIGYLCDDSNLTGPSYELTEPDGTARIVRFCEFGK